MQAPNPVETILARLMPPGLSEDCQADLNEMLTELAGPVADNVVPISSAKWFVRSLVGGGIAAAIGALCAVYPFQRDAAVAPVATAETSDTQAAYTLVSESDRIESFSDEGWKNDANGNALRALRVSSIQENSLRDSKTGLVMQVCQPSEKVLLIAPGTLNALREIPTNPAPPVQGNLIQVAGLSDSKSTVNVTTKSASCTSDEGKAVVLRSGQHDVVEISDPLGKELYRLKLPRGGSFDSLPVSWRNKVQVLCRTLDQALTGSNIQTRQPQPQVIPQSAR
jgi:hypothetical protein